MISFCKYLGLILVNFAVLISSSQTIENDMIYLKEEVDRLKTETDIMRTNISSLENQLQYFNLEWAAKMKSIKDDLIYLNGHMFNTTNLAQHDRQTMQHILNLLNGSISSLNSTIAGVQKQIQSENGKRVAFTATNLHDISVSGGETVKFETIVQDIGGQFSKTTGVFTARISGVYVFFFNIRVLGEDHICWIDLVKDGQRVVISWTHSDGNDKYDHNSEGNIGIVKLNKGNSVWLKNVVDQKPCSIDDLSSFSGFLLYPD